MTPREIDALVAEKVFGISVTDRLTGLSRPITAAQVLAKESALESIPRFTTDIAAAWEVVEKLTIGRERFHYNCLCRDPNDGMWTFGSFDRDGVFGEKSDTAPLAICLAALKAVGVEVEPTR